MPSSETWAPESSWAWHLVWLANQLLPSNQGEAKVWESGREVETGRGGRVYLGFKVETGWRGIQHKSPKDGMEYWNRHREGGCFSLPYARVLHSGAGSGGPPLWQGFWSICFMVGPSLFHVQCVLVKSHLSGWGQSFEVPKILLARAAVCWCGSFLHGWSPCLLWPSCLQSLIVKMAHNKHCIATRLRIFVHLFIWQLFIEYMINFRGWEMNEWAKAGVGVEVSQSFGEDYSNRA